MKRTVLGVLIVIAACFVYYIAHDRFGKSGHTAAMVAAEKAKPGDSRTQTAAAPERNGIATSQRAGIDRPPTTIESSPKIESHPSAASGVVSRAPENHATSASSAIPRPIVETKPNRELLSDLVADNEGSLDDDGSTPSAPPSLAKAMHKRLQQQLPDPDWAPYAERQIQLYFSLQNADFFGRFEIPVVECRSSLCEIQAASVYPDDMPKDAEIWQRVVYDMLKEPWWPQFQFKEPAIQLSNSPDERRLLFITYLIRRDAG